MECWSEKTLICFVMFDDDEVLVSLPLTPDSETLWRWLSPTIHHRMESILITDPWTIVLSHKKPHHRRVIYHQQLQWLSQWQDLCPLSRALCRVITPDCKSVRLSPSPGKPFCIRKRDAGLRFPGTTPASAPEDRIRSPVSPHPLRRVTLFVTHRPRLTTRWHRL